MTAPADFEVRFGSATSPGRVRDHNEDALLAVPPVFAVADGMGGHARGEVASSTVISALAPMAGRARVSADELIECLEDASQRVQGLADDRGAPGSTLTGVVMTEQGGVPCWLVFNIGDSRTYLMSAGTLTQVSEDHSIYAVTRAWTAPRNVITRALGGGVASPALADQWLIPATEGDRLLLCSDGLTNEVSEQLVTAVMLSEADPQRVADTLVRAAVDAGGHDNVTAVVVDAVRIASASTGMATQHTLSDLAPVDYDTIPDFAPVEGN